MRNKYPGKCYRCGETVQAREGHFEKIPTGWRVQHATCAIEFRGRKSPYEMQQETPAPEQATRSRSCKDAALDLAEAEYEADQHERRRAVPEWK